MPADGVGRGELAASTTARSALSRCIRTTNSRWPISLSISWAWWPWLSYLLAGFIQCNLLLLVPFVGAMFFVWVERKVSARIQDRLGPTRTGGKFGWLQLLADGLKLITKEDLMPKGADGLLFQARPVRQLCASFATLMALPFADGWVALPMNVGVFFIIAVLGLEVFGVILAGYASASKWSLFGAMREAAQVVSYEVPLGLCIVTPCLIAGSLDLVDDRQQQQAGAGSPTGTSSTIRSRSSSFGFTSPAPRPA